jgi:hypothetical protein
MHWNFLREIADRFNVLISAHDFTAELLYN